jgi:hypothetical protein
MNKVSEIMEGIVRKNVLGLKRRIFLKPSSWIKNDLKKYCNSSAMKSMFLNK